MKEVDGPTWHVAGRTLTTEVMHEGKKYGFGIVVSRKAVSDADAIEEATVALRAMIDDLSEAVT